LPFVKSLFEALRRTPFLTTLSDEQCAKLAGVVRPRKLRVNEALFKLGDSGDFMAILASGQLAVSVGDNAQVASIYPGEVVGEMACVDPAPRSANVTATKDSVAVELTRDMLGLLQKQDPNIAVAIVGGVITLLSRRIRDTNERIERELEARGIMPESDTSPDEPGKSRQTETSTPDKRIDLRAVPCLEAFTNDELKTLVKVAPPKTYKAMSNLCREGELGNSCFILVRGSVQVIRKMSGHERVLATLSMGATVGQMALVDRSPRSATVKALDDCVVLELQRKVFDRLLEANSSVAMRFQDQIAVAGIRQLRMANERLSDLLKKAASAPKTPQPRASKKQGQKSIIERYDAPATPQDDDMDHETVALAYMQTALKEWGMTMEEIDQVRVKHPAGVMSAAEIKARRQS
jgi:CRP-like cAMP-binding protein